MKPMKQSVPINFSGGLDLKNDPWQIGPASFLSLNNSVFTTGGRLTKRNGFPSLGTTINTPVPALTYSNIGATASVANARKVFSYENELCINDGFNLYSYDENSNSWSYKGRSTILGLSTSNIAQDGNNKTNMDMSIDTQTGIKVYAWCESDTGNYVKYSIQDSLTGQFIVNKATLGSTYVRPRCLSIAGKSWIFAVNSTDGKIYYQAIVGKTVTGSPTALITDLNATQQYYDVDVSAGNIYLTYFTTGPAIKIAQLNSSLAIVNSITQSESATHGLSMFGDGTNIWVCYNNGTNTKALIVNNAVTATVLAPLVLSVLGSSAVVNVTGSYSSTLSKGFIFWEASNVIYFIALTVAGTADVPLQIMRSVNIVSKAFSQNGIPNLVAVYQSVVQPSYFLLNLYNLGPNAAVNPYGDVAANIAAKIAPDQSGASNSAGFLCGVHNPIGSTWELALGQKTNLTEATSATTLYSPIGVIDCLFDFALSNPDQQVLANNAHIASGQLTMYDGSNVCEQNFHIYPEGTTAVISGSAPGILVYANLAAFPGSANVGTLAIAFNSGSCIGYIWNGSSWSYPQSINSYTNLAAFPSSALSGSVAVDNATENVYKFNGTAWILVGGTSPTIVALGSASANSLYSYKITYEWIDNQGQLHRSSPSPVLTPLASGQVYTFASGTTSGVVTLTIPTLRVTNKNGVLIKIYRTLANQSVYFLVNASLLSLANDSTADSVIFIDQTPDSIIQGNNQIYTTGELEDYAVPATKSLSVFKNRILTVDSESGYNFNYSKQALQGFPVEFSPEFVQNVGSVAGAISAIAGMDDKIIIFKSGLSAGPSILYMVGTGPAASGAGNDFTDPLPVAVDCGCVDRSSIVLTPNGLIFKSDKGIYQLDRSLQASYIGAPVESYNQFSVVSSQLIPNSTQVRFLLSNGTLLMYDYFFQKWASFSNPAGISDCIFQGQHTYIAVDGKVYQEYGLKAASSNILVNPSQINYYDGTNTPILMSFQTAWIKLAGLQGYQRSFFFYLLANYLSDHQLSVSLYTNFSSTPDQTDLITPNASDFLENWRIFVKNQRCQSFQIALQEVYTGTIGAAFTMSGVNLIVGAKSQFRTIPSAQSMG